MLLTLSKGLPQGLAMHAETADAARQDAADAGRQDRLKGKLAMPQQRPHSSAVGKYSAPASASQITHRW